ncbi:MAG: hypothetical protein U0Q16_37340 [Bryobacteraceae bacterium]
MHEHSLIELRPGANCSLADYSGVRLGSVRIDRVDGDRVFGKLERFAGFESVRALFRDLDEAIDANVMCAVNEIEQEVEDLGLHLVAVGGGRLPAIHHVQVYDGDTIFFRLRGGYPSDFAEIASGEAAPEPVGSSRSV